MRAIVCRELGSPDVLKTEQVEKPAPADLIAIGRDRD